MAVSVTADLDLLMTTIKSIRELDTTTLLGNIRCNTFKSKAENVANQFLSEATINKHLNDSQFHISIFQEKYKIYKTVNGQRKFDRYDSEQRAADVRAKVVEWLTTQQTNFKADIPNFENAFSDYRERLKKIHMALLNCQKEISSFDEKTYSLEEAVKKIPGYKVGSVNVSYDDSTAKEFGVGDIYKLEFVDVDGGTHTTDEAVNSAVSVGNASTETVLAAGGNNPDLFKNGLITTSLRVIGGFVGAAAANGYVTSKDSPEDLFTAAYPGREYDSEVVKEENIDYYVRVFGLSPETAAKILGEDTNSEYLGAAVMAPLMLAMASSSDDPEHSFLSGAETSKILESLGVDKTIEEIREDHKEYIEELREMEKPEEVVPELDSSLPRQLDGGNDGRTSGTQLSHNVNETSETAAESISSVISEGPNYNPTQSVIDTGGRLNQSVDASINELLKPTTSVDSQALSDYYGKGLESIESERAGLLSTFEDAYNGINVDQFKETLAKGGYSMEDINYIMDHKEVGFTALVMATQTSALTDISNSIAASQGMVGFDTAYNNGLKVEDLINGRAQASLGVEMDPDVSSARTKMSSMRNNYSSSVDKANASIKQAGDDKAALDRIRERIIKKSGTDASKWSDEDVKEYNEAVTKYNNSNARANEDVEAANKLKNELEKFENDFEKMKNEKFDELLSEYQKTISSQQPSGSEMPVQEGLPGEGTPGEGYDGSDSSILATITGGDSGLSVGNGEQALGVVSITPQQPSYDGSDSAILGGLNLGGSGLSIGTPDASMGLEAPIIPSDSGVNNIVINADAFGSDGRTLNALDLGYQTPADNRVLPSLGLNIDMNTITGGSVNGISTYPGSSISDAAILNSLNMANGGISTSSSSYNDTSFTSIETPSLNTMVSPDFDKAMSSGSLTTSDVDSAVRESSTKKTDTSRFVEAPTSENQQQVSQQMSNMPRTEVENGIVIELGEDGSLRL